VEKNSRKGKQKNKCRENIIGLKKLKLKLQKRKKKKHRRRKKIREKRENPPELQKSNVERQRFITIKNVTEKKKEKKIQKLN